MNTINELVGAPVQSKGEKIKQFRDMLETMKVLVERHNRAQTGERYPWLSRLSMEHNNQLEEQKARIRDNLISGDNGFSEEEAAEAWLTVQRYFSGEYETQQTQKQVKEEFQRLWVLKQWSPKHEVKLAAKLSGLIDN